jgi:hypothetical protein
MNLCHTDTDILNVTISGDNDADIQEKMQVRMLLNSKRSLIVTGAHRNDLLQGEEHQVVGQFENPNLGTSVMPANMSPRGSPWDWHP